MPRTVEFIVYGSPKPQPRPQFRAVVPATDVLVEVGKCPEVRNAAEPYKEFRKQIQVLTRVYPREYPEAITEWKAGVQAAWVELRQPRFSGPISVLIEVVLPRPKRKVHKLRRCLREWDERQGSPGGDADNFGKAILDALIAYAFADDSSVCSLQILKLMADQREVAHARIRISELGDVPGYEPVTEPAGKFPF